MTDSLETQVKTSIKVSLKYLASSESNADYVVISPSILKMPGITMGISISIKKGFVW